MTAASNRGLRWGDPLWRRALGWLSPAGAPARLSIMIFHRVLPEPDPLFPGDPDRERFDTLCGWLAAWYNVLPLDEAVQRLRQRSLPERALAITFDDGYADNHDIAMPVLRAHGLCATFFIATGFLDGGRMWNDTVIEALRHCTAAELDLEGLGPALPPRLDLSTIEARRASMERLLPACKYLRPDERLRVVERIAERARVVPRSDLMLSSAQVKAMAAAGMQIGAHTVNHPILARLDEHEARFELAHSKGVLEDLLGAPVPLFAYPNGVPDRDYGARDVALARAAGFAAAVSTAPGAACADDPLQYELPRFTPWDRGRAKFALRLARNLRRPAPPPAQPASRQSGA